MARSSASPPTSKKPRRCCGPCLAARQITQSSDVAFAELSDQTIAAYCATSEPYDKAGGYAIQGLASLFIKDIAGSYSGIMGLPLFETSQLLQQAGLRIL